MLSVAEVGGVEVVEDPEHPARNKQPSRESASQRLMTQLQVW